MNKMILHTKAQLNGNSLTLPENLSFDEWQDVGRKFKEVNNRIQFWIGDWIRFAENKRYNGQTSSDVYDLAEKLTGYSRNTLWNFKHVATRTASRRREALSFDMHKEVITLEPKLQIKLLEKAENENLKILELREEVKLYKQQQKESQQDAAPEPKPKKEPKQPPPQTKRDLSEHEYELLQKYQAGETIIINITEHLHLKTLAETEGRFINVYEGMWANPFVRGEDGTQDEVNEKYEKYYLPHKTGLNQILHVLKGRVLGSRIYPTPCHATVLIKHI